MRRGFGPGSMRAPQNLDIFNGGFGQLAQDAVDRLQEKHVRCYFSTSIRYAAQNKRSVQVEQEDGVTNFTTMFFYRFSDVALWLGARATRIIFGRYTTIKVIGCTDTSVGTRKTIF